MHPVQVQYDDGQLASIANDVVGQTLPVRAEGKTGFAILVVSVIFYFFIFIGVFPRPRRRCTEWHSRAKRTTSGCFCFQYGAFATDLYNTDSKLNVEESYDAVDHEHDDAKHND